MDDQKPQLNENKSKKSIAWIISVIVLSLAVIGLAVWVFLSYSDLDRLRYEKEKQRKRFITEVDSLMAEHNQVKEEYGELSDSLHVKDSIIIANAKEIKRLLDYKWEYYQVNKKFKRLQTIAQGYVQQMDSLYRINKELKEENIRIKKDFETQVEKNKELTEMKERLSEKVDKASVLQTYNLKVEGIQIRWSGRKEKVVDKARRVDEIKICFSLGENPIIPEGIKKLYVRIARPDKLILTPSRGDVYSFMYRGEKLQYSIMKEVNYKGEPIDMCLYWKKRSENVEMMAGTYHVEIFLGDNVIGHTKFYLE